MTSNSRRVAIISLRDTMSSWRRLHPLQVYDILLELLLALELHEHLILQEYIQLGHVLPELQHVQAPQPVLPVYRHVLQELLGGLERQPEHLLQTARGEVFRLVFLFQEQHRDMFHNLLYHALFRDHIIHVQEHHVRRVPSAHLEVPFVRQTLMGLFLQHLQ
ncbi:hypothetical protein J437_LFUL013903 [Ladona fulva]|nr:hypothetical protein J437_LFUL013903 [Ladona fulva]